MDLSELTVAELQKVEKTSLKRLNIALDECQVHITDIGNILNQQVKTVSFDQVHYFLILKGKIPELEHMQSVVKKVIDSMK